MPDAVQQALDGRRFDVVYDNVYDWERGTTAAQVEATVRACGDRLQRYIFMSSVAAYGDGLNHHEGDALAPDDHPDSLRAQQGHDRAHAVPHAPAHRPAGGDVPAAVHLWAGQSVLSRSVLLGPPARWPVRSSFPATATV